MNIQLDLQILFSNILCFSLCLVRRKGKSYLYSYCILYSKMGASKILREEGRIDLTPCYVFSKKCFGQKIIIKGHGSN